MKRQRHNHALATKLYSRPAASRVLMLLDRLEHVRPAGDGRWRARCPVHGGENKGTLSIKSCSDGMVLLHCHARECTPLDVVKVCGLEMNDIMPERLTHYATPQERRKWREAALHQDWKEAANIVGAEARVVWVAAAELAADRPLNDADQRRHNQAVNAIDQQRKLLNGN